MAAPGGEDSAPPPPISDSVAFRKLVASGGKRKHSVPVPKFIKKLEEIPEIALPETQAVKIALALCRERAGRPVYGSLALSKNHRRMGPKELEAPS
jgi:hypothetical protein